MVFESVVTDVLNRFLGDYIENLDSKQLKIGIWGGDVVLQNLVLKQSALNDLDLPIQTVFGRLEKLVLKIPWKNLYGEAVEATIEGLYLLVKPNNQVKYDFEKEEKRSCEAKRAELQKIDEAKKREKAVAKTDDTFVEKLVTQIIKNVQLSIKNIHIRYEDSLAEHPYGMGITLSSLTVQTTDENWAATVVSDMVQKIYKIVSLEGLAVYWNCNPKMYCTMSTEDLKTIFQNEIATRDHLPQNYKYILGPISSAARLKLNPKPELDPVPFEFPKAHAELVIEQLYVGITKCQYRDLIAFADSMSYQTRGLPYRRYRPDLPSYKGHYKQWWIFAYTCILETQVRRKKNDWNWDHMHQHRLMCRNYGAAYKCKLTSKKVPQDQQLCLDLGENKMDLINLVLVRQQIELEVERMDKKREVQQSKGWFSGWWSKGNDQENQDIADSANILSKFQMAMTAEEKQKLFKAIDYKENMIPTSYPSAYIDTVVRFHLKEFEINVENSKKNLNSVVKSNLKNVKCNIERRPVKDGLKVAVFIENFTVFGTPRGDTIPEIVSSKTNEQRALLDVLFEINPLESTCGQRLHVKAEPIRILFDAKTVFELIDTFKLPPNSSIEQLSQATTAKLNDIKGMSATGLQHVIDKHICIDLLIDLAAPYVIIPYGGSFTGAENVLVLNLGKIYMRSVERTGDVSSIKQMHKEGVDKEEVLQKMILQSYEKFIVKLTNVHIMVAQGDEDYLKYIFESSDVSPMHLLTPLNLNLTLEMCLIPDDPKLPLTKITGEMPLLNINITDTRLLLLISLVNSIVSAMGEDAHTVTTLVKASSSISMNKLFELVDNKTNVVLKIPEKPKTVQMTMLEATFELKELQLTLGSQEMLSAPIHEILRFNVNSVKCIFVQQTFNMQANILLDTIYMDQYIGGVLRNIISTENYGGNSLFKVKFMQVNKKSPDFHGKYGSCESSLHLDFTSITFVLNQEGLLDIIKYANAIQSHMAELNEPAPRFGHSGKKRSISLNSAKLLSVASMDKQVSKVPKKKITNNILFKLVANVDAISVIIENNSEAVTSFAVKSVSSEIILKEAYTKITACLHNINIQDLNPKTAHATILCVELNEKAIDTDIILYNTDVVKASCNISIQASLGRIKLCFVNSFIQNVLSFSNNFQAAQQVIQEASNKAAQAAKENMHSVYEKATKVSMNINLKAPEIVVPESSVSLCALVVDLGHIIITNRFTELTTRNEAGHYAVIDELHLKLEQIKVERVKIDKEFSYSHRIPLLEPLSFSLLVNRNLSPWYNAVPTLDIDGNIDTIELKLGRPDYETIMKILTGNLAEGTSKALPLETCPDESQPESSVTVRTSSEVSTYDAAPNVHDESQINTLVRWNLVMKCFKINLYTAATRMSSQELKNTFEYTRVGLAAFSLEGLSVRGSMLSNSTISNILLLSNCLLIDSRPGRENKINCFICRREDDSELPAGISRTTARNMIDVTFQQKASDTFIDVRVYSFTFILSVEYLLKLSSFFVVPENQQTKQVSIKNMENKPKEKQEVAVTMFTLTLKVEKPYIILVEHLDSIDTRALILNCEVLLKLRMSGERQNITATIKDMQMYTCMFDPLKREATKNSFLAPTTVSMAGSTPENKGLHIEIFVSDICVSVSLYTIELISTILNSLSGTGTVQLSEVETLEDHSNTWGIQKIKDDAYWFLKSDVATDAMNYNFPNEKLSVKAKPDKLNELCILNVPVILLTLEAGVGNKTFPMLVLESRFEGKINDWSQQMAIEASLSIQMGYYNSLLALWEPLIEPLTSIDDNGTHWKPWEIKLEVSMNDTNEDASPVDNDPNELLTLQPAMSIDISSSNNLELTVTKTCLDVLTSLGKLFGAAINSKEMQHVEKSAPYNVINASGMNIELLLGESEFTVLSQDKADVIRLENGAEVMLDLKGDFVKNLVSVLSNMDKPPAERLLKISVPEMQSTLELPVVRADSRYFKLQDKRNWGLVSSVKVDNGVTIITICSILQIHNYFNTSIDLYYMRNTGNELEYISTIKPGSSIYVPLNAVYSQTSELFFSIANYSVTSTPYVWKDLQLNVLVSKNLICYSKDNSENLFVIRAVGEMSQIYYETTLKHTMASTIYNIYLKPAVILKNCLPINIHLCVRDVINENIIEPGHQLEIPNVEPGTSYIVIRLSDYLEKEWSCRREVQLNPQQFTVWTFESYDSPNKVSLDLGMHILQQNGTMIMSLYCPFWMINKTGLVLGYRSTDENLNILHHPPFFKGPILFSFNAKNFFGKKKACVRIDQGEWSEKFSIDVAGSSGVVVCKHKGKIHQIGVGNRLTYNGLTKQITFTPYYVIINHSPLTIECQELDRPGDPWITIAPKSCCAMWPCSELDDKLIKVRIEKTEEITAPFLITESHTTLLKLKNKYGGINVDIQLTEGATYINLALYDTGMAPALIINHTKHTMNIWEKESVQIKKLLPSHNMYYTWDNPSAERVLVWEAGYGKELENDLRMDGVGEYNISEDSIVYWTSFLDGMQRVLLFTCDSHVITNVQASKQFELVDKEITMSIYGLGLSLVNNLKRQEIMYIGIASTGIIWETCKFHSKRFKQMSTKDNFAMERAYQLHLLKEGENVSSSNVLTVIDDRNEVNFDLMIMQKPHKRKIRRQFQTGLWFQMKTSPHQMQIHAKVNRLQIDNQLYDCTFPVLLAPVPPPKSIALNDAHKPFAELSVVQLLIKNSQIRQFKYFKILIQEFHIKVDLSFINAIMEIFDTTANSDQEERDHFLIDCGIVQQPLYMLVSTHSLQEQKSFYDLLHFSPLKIHVSFSMAASGTSQGIGNIPVFLSVLLQGIGVTLTDLQDVVFKLAYFQREYSFLTQRQLVDETTAHYLGQTVKQLYVLVLGLDVIGNPYGLVLGITKGVEDLFYEPFQGAIQGPGEFAEGLMLGVASLFGHTVGGAAGAVSRITGAMGKGIAALTFDKEYQRKRRDQINKKPATVHEGLARGGKGLVMGVVDGVTGVFTKPISGAKEQGVGGFFKGLGKGAVGLVTRPTAGVMDFASTSFETVKRVTDMGQGYVNRLRTPRFVEADCCVKPYNSTLAYGNTLLCELEKGKYYATDIYSMHFIIIEKKEVLLLSNKRMAYIVHNDMFGGWQVDWAYTWQEIEKQPSIVPKGVQVHVDSKKKGLFHGNDNGKVIFMSDPKLCEKLVAQIIQHMNAN